MKKIEYCQALPGCCWACGSSDREWFLDSERSIDFYGAVYFCNLCIEEWATIAGMASVEETENLNSNIKAQEVEIFDLTVRVSGLEQAIDGLRFAGSFSRNPPLPSPVLPSSPSAEAVPSGEESMGFEGGTSLKQDDDSDVGELHTDESRSDESSFSLDL